MFSPDVHTLQHELERLQKRYPEAIAAFDKVLARNPKELRALVGRGETRLTQGDADGALADGEAARRLRSNLPAANFLRGRVLLAKKNLPAAQEALLEVLRFVPDHLPSQLLLGAIAFQNNNLEQADAYLSRYVAAVPNQLPARKLLAGTAMKLKQPKRAIDLLAPVAAAGSTLVNSPIATACFACHDTTQAMAHMRTNGGSIYAPRSTALGTVETCMICHDSGRIADIKVMHAK